MTGVSHEDLISNTRAVVVALDTLKQFYLESLENLKQNALSDDQKCQIPWMEQSLEKVQSALEDAEVCMHSFITIILL